MYIIYGNIGSISPQATALKWGTPLSLVHVRYLISCWASCLLGVTAEALRAKIDRKSAISLQRGQFDPKFQVVGDVPPPIILHG